MINLETIKAVLFSNEEMRAEFLVRANEYTPPIPGMGFDEKLAFLLNHASEDALQILIAPFLRERVFQYLTNEETDIARGTKQTFIKESGIYLYESMLSGTQEAYGRVASQTYLNKVRQDFNDLKHQFTIRIGEKAWEILVHSPQNIEHEYTADLASFSFHKNLFQDAFPQPENLWERIHQATPAVQDFDILRQLYINTWGEQAWSKNYDHGRGPGLSSIPEEDETDNEEDLGFPMPPNSADDFLVKKNDFIDKYGISDWTNCAQLVSPSEPALRKAYELKNQFVQEAGQRRWSRIYSPPAFVKTFDELKKSFIDKWDQHTWDIYSLESEDIELDPTILADFLERKNDSFIPKWGPDLWVTAKRFPAIPADARQLHNELQNRFIHKWGTVEWQEYLETHRTDGEYATDKQLTILAELFDLKFDVTSISDGVTQTTQHIRRTGAQTIHFYCENLVHYYIHANGYNETIGNGNCGYNSFAQWMKLLLLGLSPRQAVVMPAEGDLDENSVFLVQNALLPDPGSSRLPGQDKIDDTVKPFVFNEELSINTFRKELALPLNFASSSELAKFLHTKAQATIHVIRSKSLPCNRIRLLQKTSTLAEELGRGNKHDKLILLQQILYCIVTTVYLPHTQHVSEDWTQLKFTANINDLEKLIEHPIAEFADLQAAIKATDFLNKAPIGYIESFFAPPISYSTNIRPYHISAAEPYHEDLLSSILCVSGIFIFLVGLSALAILIGMAIFSGPFHLGIILMHYGFQTVATSLGGILGVSAPNSAVLVASSTATMVTGLGFTLFKDFAPPEMLTFSPLCSNTMALA